MSATPRLEVKRSRGAFWFHHSERSRDTMCYSQVSALEASTFSATMSALEASTFSATMSALEPSTFYAKMSALEPSTFSATMSALEGTGGTKKRGAQKRPSFSVSASVTIYVSMSILVFRLFFQLFLLGEIFSVYKLVCKKPPTICFLILIPHSF